MDELACHYANALFGLAKDKTKEYGVALREVRNVLDEEEELSKALRSFSVPVEEQQAVVDSCFGRASLPHLAPFLKVVVSHHRMGMFDSIEEAYHSLVNESEGVKEGVVYSAVPLERQQKEAIEKALGKKLGCKVELKNSVDVSLLGGAKVALDGKVYDGTLRNKLNELHAELSQGGNAQ